MDQVQVQVVVGIVASYVMEFLKRQPWFPVLSEHSTDAVKKAFGVLVAAGSALAITFSFDPTLGRLTVDGLTWSNMGHGLLTFFTSLIAQHSAFRLLIRKEA